MLRLGSIAVSELAVSVSGELSSLTLEELAEKAKAEHQLSIESAIMAVRHAIRVGEILLVVRERLDFGEYEAWVEKSVGITYSTASRYVRIAYYKDRLPPTDETGAFGKPSAAEGINAAQEFLKGLPNVPHVHGSNGRVATQADKELAKQMKADGASYATIGEALGRNQGTIYYWLNPDKAKRNTVSGRKRRQEARKARRLLEAQEKRAASKALAKSLGGAVGDAYSTIRVHLEALDKAVSASSDNREAYVALRAAQDYAYKVEDKIAEALKVS